MIERSIAMDWLGRRKDEGEGKGEDEGKDEGEEKNVGHTFVCFFFSNRVNIIIF